MRYQHRQNDVVFSLDTYRDRAEVAVLASIKRDAQRARARRRRNSILARILLALGVL